MTLRRPNEILPFRVRKRSKADALADPLFVALVMEHWGNGKNTADIAEFTFEDESVVACVLAFGREQRRRERG